MNELKIFEIRHHQYAMYDNNNVGRVIIGWGWEYVQSTSREQAKRWAEKRYFKAEIEVQDITKILDESILPIIRKNAQLSTED